MEETLHFPHGRDVEVDSGFKLAQLFIGVRIGGT